MKTKRLIYLQGLGKTLELAKVTKLVLATDAREFINFDKMPDGNWRLVYTEHTIPDLPKLEALKIIRQEEA